MTCTNYNWMGEYDRGSESGLRERDGQHLRTGQGKGRSRWIPPYAEAQTSDTRGYFHGEPMGKALSLNGL